MLTTDKLQYDDKIYEREYLRCDTCGLEIDVGVPTVFVKVSCGMTQVSKEYHKYCVPGEIIRILADG